MADLCCEYTLALASTRKLNEAGVSTLIPREITGLDGRPVRSTINPVAGADGGDKLTSRFGPRLIVFSGDILIYGAGGEPLDPTKGGSVLTDYLTRLNALAGGWCSDLEGKLNTAFNLSYTPTGGSAVVRSVTYGFDGGVWTVGGTTYEPTFSFGLVCESD